MGNWVFKRVRQSSKEALAEDRAELATSCGEKNIIGDGIATYWGAPGNGKPKTDPIHQWLHFFELTDDGLHQFRHGTVGAPAGWSEWPFLTPPYGAEDSAFLSAGPETPFPLSKLVEELMCRDCPFPMKGASGEIEQWLNLFGRRHSLIGEIVGAGPSIYEMIGCRLLVVGPDDVYDTMMHPNRVVIEHDGKMVVSGVKFG